MIGRCTCPMRAPPLRGLRTSGVDHFHFLRRSGSLASGIYASTTNRATSASPTFLVFHQARRTISTATSSHSPPYLRTTCPTPPRFLNIIQSKTRSITTNTSTSSGKMAVEPTVQTLFEPVTGTWQYIVACPKTKEAAIIDPVLDFDPAKNLLSTTTADKVLEEVEKAGYKINYILETHAHADHLTASNYLQTKLAEKGQKPQIGIGKRIVEVQERFGNKYGISKDEWEGVFDKYFEDDESFQIGELESKTLYLPGHTPDHLGYQIGSNVFCGDSLFNADVGSARCDFPGGDAKALYASVQKLLSLPGNFKIYTGHDYPPEDRKDPLPYMTVAEQQERNKHLKKGTSEDQFVSWRRDRDSGLSPPRLLHQSLQFNIRAGRQPRATKDGDKLLHLPLKSDAKGW